MKIENVSVTAQIPSVQSSPESDGLKLLDIVEERLRAMDTVYRLGGSKNLEAIREELGRVRSVITGFAQKQQEPAAWRYRSKNEPRWEYFEKPLIPSDLFREERGFQEQPLFALSNTSTD